MTTLVVGAGLVGSQIARLELERGESVIIFDASPRIDALADIFPVNKVKIIQGDVIRPDEVNRVVKDEAIDYIYHTAAFPGFTVSSANNPSTAINVNVIGFVNILEAARLFDVKKVLFTSSNTISTYVRPARDDVLSFNKEYAFPRPSTIYAATKLASENFGLIYADSYGIDFRAVRLAAVFGPWRHGGGGVPSNLMHNLVLKSLLGQPLSLSFGDFEYIYSKDAGNGSVMACRAHSVRDRVFNIGLGKFYTFKEIVGLIHEIIPQSKVTISSEGAETRQKMGSFKAMPNPVVSEPLDLTRSREQLGYAPKYQMKDAIMDYVEFFKKIGLA